MVEWEYPTKPREASGLDPEAVHVFFVFEQSLKLVEAGDVPVKVFTVIERVVVAVSGLPDEAVVVEPSERCGDGAMGEFKMVFEFFGFEPEFGVVVEECDYVGVGCPGREFDIGFVGVKVDRHGCVLV